MKKVCQVVGNIVAVLGILVCVVAGLTRLAGSFYILTYPAITLFTGGIALMVMACLAKLQQLLMS